MNGLPSISVKKYCQANSLCLFSRIGMGELFPGFDIAVRSMCVGEESEFVIRHE